MGPWRVPIFYIVFNPDSIYFYPLNEARLYNGQNRPEDIQRLTGIPMDLSRLFDSLVSNLPEALSQCSLTFSEGGYHSLLCMNNTDQGTHLMARILIRDLPLIEEMCWMGGQVYENLTIRYMNISAHNGYYFPEDISFYWQGGQECHIRFNALKVNPPVSSEVFLPDEKWFQGDIIDLKALDTQDG